ncbi:MAG: hypothetical protein ABIQ00_15100 [Chitinophagaceae bacterium]
MAQEADIFFLPNLVSAIENSTDKEGDEALITALGSLQSIRDLPNRIYRSYLISIRKVYLLKYISF